MKKIAKYLFLTIIFFVILLGTNCIFNKVQANFAYTFTETDSGKIKVVGNPNYSYENNKEYDGKKDNFLYNIDKESKNIQIARVIEAKEEITFPAEIDGYKVKSISNHVFGLISQENNENIKKIKKIIISEGIETIGYLEDKQDGESNWGAFENLAELKEVVLASTIKEIKGYTFRGCTNLEKINLHRNLERIGDCAFYKCGFNRIKIGKNVSKIGKKAFSGCENLNSIKVDVNNKSFSSKGGVLFDKNKTYLIAWPCSKNTKEYKIASTVKAIQEYAFYKAKYLESVIIPKKVTMIPRKTFDSCRNLKSVTLPKKLSKISKKAFYKCTSLTSINIPKNVSWIDSYAFAKCKKVKALTIPAKINEFSMLVVKDCSNFKKLTFKNSKTKINNGNQTPNINKLVIYGYKNSKVQKFAKKYSLKFKAL